MQRAEFEGKQSISEKPQQNSQMASDPQFDLFFSYNHDSSPEVRELYAKLKAAHGGALSIWIDYEQWEAGRDANELLMLGLERSKCVLCFVTSKYSESVACRRELAQALKKPHAILMLEHLGQVDKAVQFQVEIESRLNFYWNRGRPSLWVGDEYEKLLRTVAPHVSAQGLGMQMFI